MPNEPLQTYRAVDPVGYHFGSIATTASQPFVLNHFASPTVLGTAALQANVPVAFNAGDFLTASRFLPWVSRDYDTPLTGGGAYYPVRVPNAYDRIYIFPMYYIVGSASVSAWGTLGGYSAPYILPMGLTPQTRGFTDVNKMNPKLYRFPEDIPEVNGYTRHTGTYSIRSKGLWIPLSSYATNALTNNGFMGAATATDARSFGRSVAGTGTTYKLPNDLSISNAAGAALTEAANQYAAGTAGTAQPPIIGMGLEFQTHGCEEIVCCIGSVPTGFTLNIPIGNNQAHRVEMFMMGMFLG
jgi:hypothetical protein